MSEEFEVLALAVSRLEAVGRRRVAAAGHNGEGGDDSEGPEPVRVDASERTLGRF